MRLNFVFTALIVSAAVAALSLPLLAPLAHAAPSLPPLPQPGEAAAPRGVVVAWGAAADWLLSGALAALGGVAGVAAWALRKLPAHLRAIALALRVEQLLTHALNDGLNRTRGTLRGQTVTLDLGLEVANAALRYAVQHAPTLVQELGVLDVWRKILARVPFEADAAVPQSTSPDLAGPQFAALVR